jgi:PST family polysaccharide transporter
VLPLILGASFEHSAHILQIFAWMFPFAAFNEFVAGYIFLPRKKDRLLAAVGIGSGLFNVVVALILAPRYGAVGLAVARVIGETIMSVMLIGLVIRLEMVSLIPGGERTLTMVRAACRSRSQPDVTKDE